MMFTQRPVFLSLLKKKNKKPTCGLLCPLQNECLCIACSDNLSSAIELLTQMHEPGSHYVLNPETARIIDLGP